ncbi:DUF1622 domain-containing protein [Fluoribacter dumoffii]|uniref:Protein of uncharacterized function (DUF1622) n=1 Tax=Fluoribacter dumoffii TaxID=463 RepID=A0A377GCD8_9GAMM|nr:DUF1622 domain-containing protein [Fluoribacter dumoffii]KTC90922.1 hypothetical protein Ldum_1990 [Fluoribacter dumoffii NY 23]MCW8419545.1 DUF1622 domain-containing protein [Fluoribacter dumoffii]MCW8455752.1 DUF1622 domain-containing protein [Fluoribacter dumoffii]MCW8460169.1 DUF1622 domain-containing protein [Fluoribacter dumoffii]MCW8483648.1 DUF1622 domain-containing protein [Fluoribacter dumoffii]
MELLSLHSLLLYIQHSISFCGVLVILLGVLAALFRYLSLPFYGAEPAKKMDINQIRLKLGRVLTLGLEFIVAADLIGTTTAPDYYSVGIVASIVLIRTLLSFTLNREINAISKQEYQKDKI